MNSFLMMKTQLKPLDLKIVHLFNLTYLIEKSFIITIYLIYKNRLIFNWIWQMVISTYLNNKMFFIYALFVVEHVFCKRRKFEHKVDCIECIINDFIPSIFHFFSIKSINLISPIIWELYSNKEWLMDNIGFMHKITENMVRVALMKTTKQNRITQ